MLYGLKPLTNDKITETQEKTVTQETTETQETTKTQYTIDRYKRQEIILCDCFINDVHVLNFL